MSADWLNYTFRERRNFPRRYVTVHGYDDLWQTNVVEMRPYMRFNRGYHYILTVIDVLSKHAEPLKVKSGNKVTAKIIRDDIRKICILIEERNFTIRMWTETLEETQYQPLFYVFRNKGVGRFNCTLKTTWKQFTHNGNYKWINILSRLVSNYNARKHRTIDMHQRYPAIVDRLLTVYNRIKIIALARYKVDDSIRVNKFKTVFIKFTHRIGVRRCLKLNIKV